VKRTSPDHVDLQIEAMLAVSSARPGGYTLPDPAHVDLKEDAQWQNRSPWKYSPITFDRGVISVPGVLKN
jgi:hypothetical protein